MFKRITQSWKPLLFLLISAVGAGFLFYMGWLDERVLVALGIGGFITIVLLVVLANKVIRKNADRIQEVYDNQQHQKQVKGG